jgi:hypothetical protein
MARSYASSVGVVCIAIVGLLAVAIIPGPARAGRLVSDPDAGSPDSAELASRNPTLEIPRIYAPDGSEPDDIAQPGTADDNEDDVDTDSYGPAADSPDADIPDLPDSGAIAVNPDDLNEAAPDANAANVDQDPSAPDYAASNPNVGTAQDYSDQINQPPPMVVMHPVPFYASPAVPAYQSPYVRSGPTPYYASPAAGIYTYTRVPPSSAYMPPGYISAFAGGTGSPPAWGAPPALGPMGPIMSPPVWVARPTMPLAGPMGMRSFPMR